MTDLRAFTPRPGRPDGERSRRLDWTGIAHWNTYNPHVHLVVAASQMTVPISSSRAITSVMDYARGPTAPRRASGSTGVWDVGAGQAQGLGQCRASKPVIVHAATLPQGQAARVELGDTLAKRTL
jgi:hypothetical protein